MLLLHLHELKSLRTELKEQNRSDEDLYFYLLYFSIKCFYRMFIYCPRNAPKYLKVWGFQFLGFFVLKNFPFSYQQKLKKIKIHLWVGLLFVLFSTSVENINSKFFKFFIFLR